MTTLLIVVQLPAYVLLLLIAGYLLARSRDQALSLSIAGVLIGFALILADQFLGETFPDQAPWIGRALWCVYPLPVTLWLRVGILLIPGEALALDRAWWTLVLPVTVLLILGGWIGDDLVKFATRDPGPLYWTFSTHGIVVSLLSVALFYRLVHQTSPGDRARRVFIWMGLAGIGYMGAMLILVIGLLAPEIVFTAVIIDVLLLGTFGIVYDALAEGQSVGRDFAAVALKTLIVAAMLILPWSISLLIADRWSIEAAVALLITLGAATVGVPLQDALDHRLDRLVWRGTDDDEPATRAALRVLLSNSARQSPDFPPVATLDRDEFTRLTRRALSNMPDLPRLAASPLADLHIVSERAGADADTLQRANTLRAILAECIDALRPSDRGAFGTTDEWRFYNALYYPYVAGIRPYRHNALALVPDDDHAEVVRWFQAEVPQRTMYNWQNHAAERIAAILLERESRLAS